MMMMMMMMFYGFCSTVVQSASDPCLLYDLNQPINVCAPQVENVRLLDRSAGQRKASVVTLYLSSTHTIFVEKNPETRKETWVRP